jgi:asparagine synthase (glutamine-hydrolysing)
MCGIVGCDYEDKDFLKKALKEIKHRGPDQSGVYYDENVSLGHNRLSILDLSSNGKQPMSDKSEKVWIVFNGEIYNYSELKKLLPGIDFKSDSDTEVLIYLYKKYGIKMLEMIQGMFTFCIYDIEKKIFFIARDRVGIKPLYYHNSNRFIFCSEIKGILQDSSIKRVFNSNVLDSYLIFRANTKEETFFKGIKKLMPGNYIIYDLKKKNLTINKYWDLSFSKNSNPKELKNLLLDSVKSRLVSDVPYGAYLSGGVDSGIIVALMKEFSSQPIKTFSVGFDIDSHSETNEARFLAERLKTDHHELLINENSVESLPNIVYHADEPMADPTSIPIYYLSKYAKKYCTVILTGEGADELFSGYPQYRFMDLNKKFISSFPQTLRHSLTKGVKLIPKKFLDKGFKFASSLGEKGIERFSNYINTNNPAEQYLQMVAIFNEKEQSELLNKNIQFYNKFSKYYSKKDLIMSSQIMDFKEPMVDDLLMKVDRNTMAHAIEGRVPFLDHRVVEFAFNLSTSKKLSYFQNKIVLRNLAKGIIPKQTQNRKKRHFFVPIDNWFKNELSTLKEELLSTSYIRKQNIFNMNYINKINKNFNSSRLFYSRQMWALIVFQIWYKQFIEKEKVAI